MTTSTSATLIERAQTKYFDEAERHSPDQPDRGQEIDLHGTRYVVLSNINGSLAIYRADGYDLADVTGDASDPIANAWIEASQEEAATTTTGTIDRERVADNRAYVERYITDMSQVNLRAAVLAIYRQDPALVLGIIEEVVGHEVLPSEEKAELLRAAEPGEL